MVHINHLNVASNKIYLKTLKIMLFVTGHGLLMLLSLGGAIAIHVHLKMDKTLDCFSMLK